MQQVHVYLEPPFMSITGDKDTSYMCMYKAYSSTFAWTHYQVVCTTDVTKPCHHVPARPRASLFQRRLWVVYSSSAPTDNTAI